MQAYLGSGGSAMNFRFDATGLSSDPNLPSYMQNLTPAQLQSALNGESPNADLSSLLYQDVTGTGAGSLPDGSGGVTTATDWGAIVIFAVAALALALAVKQ